MLEHLLKHFLITQKVMRLLGFQFYRFRHFLNRSKAH